MSSNAKKNIIIFLSSVRPNRMAERVGNFVKKAVEARGMNPILFDPLEMMFELVQLPIHFMPNPEEAPKWLQDANTAIKSADGFIIVSAEYNCSLPPALANMMDHFPPSAYRHRPCGLVGYSMGVFGGARVLPLLRSFTAELGMLPVPTIVPIPTVQNVFTEDGSTCNEERVENNINKLLDDVEWYADALKNHAAIKPWPTA